MVKHQKSHRVLIVIFVLGAIYALLPYVILNYVTLQINSAFANQLPIPKHLADRLVSLEAYSLGRSPHWYRHLGRIYFEMDDAQLAADYWQKSGLPVEYITAFGHIFFLQQNFVESLAWYEVATISEPNNVHIWLDVGLVCQNGFWQTSLCQHFLKFNQMNYLLNSDLLLGELGWHTTHSEIAEHTIGDCPDFAQNCLKIEIVEESSGRHPSWAQCLHLTPSKTYEFSAWLLVEGSSQDNWRPLYYQGRIQGEIRGFWSETKQGESVWQFWSQTLSVDDFDDYRICLHPIRLESGGAAWIHSPQLVEIEN